MTTMSGKKRERRTTYSQPNKLQLDQFRLTPPQRQPLSLMPRRRIQQRVDRLVGCPPGGAEQPNEVVRFARDEPGRGSGVGSGGGGGVRHISGGCFFGGVRLSAVSSILSWGFERSSGGHWWEGRIDNGVRRLSFFKSCLDEESRKIEKRRLRNRLPGDFCYA